MIGFIVKTANGQNIRFRYYIQEAPVTSAAFDACLPFTEDFLHARVSGQEIWTDAAPELDVIQENASVFTFPGEVVLGPSKPIRAKTRHAMGIYYGEGKGLDSCNIFARVYDEDLQALQALGEQIWKEGMQQLKFEKLIPEE